MKTIRKILLFVAIVLLILVLAGYFLPRIVSVERSIYIHATPEVVFNHVNTIKTWNNWSPWFSSNQVTGIAFSGPTAGVGATLSFINTDKKFSTGKVSIIKSEPFTLIASDFDFTDLGQASCIFRFRKTTAGTLVSMALECTLGHNPLSRWIGIMMDRMVGSDLESSLKNIELECVSVIKINENQVVEKNFPSRTILGVRDTASPETFRLTLERSYSELNKYLTKEKLRISGFPMIIYHLLTSKHFDFEVCVPIDSMVSSFGRVKCRLLPPTRSVMTVFNGYGRADTVSYMAIENYLQKNKLIVSGACWEEYVTDPANTTDTSKWQTYIIYPVR